VISIDLANSIFIGCVLIGGGLLLITVLLDDILGGVLDFLHLDIDLGGVSLMPVLLGFVSMFGVGGLIGLEVFDLGSGPAAVLGGAFGMFGAGIVYVLFSFLRKAEGPEAFSLDDLVGKQGRVSVGIRARRNGTVLLAHGGQSHQLTATADEDIAAGSTVTITGTAGPTVIVAPLPRSSGGNADA
jgi:membrane protein implicated in regulation of membrane protease activity